MRLLRRADPCRFGRHAWRIWRDACRAAAKHGLSPFRILREQVVLKFRTGLGPAEYLECGLDDPGKGWEEKLTYVGSKRLAALWRVLTPTKYQYVYKNKVVFKHFFGALGFPLARLYGIYDPFWGRTAEGEPLRTASDIAAWMTARGVQEAVFKPMEGGQGQMVLVLAARKAGAPGSFVDLRGNEYSPRRIVEFLGDPDRLREAYPDDAVPPRTMLVEERLHQHPLLEELVGETLSCVRVVTLTTLDGRVEIIQTGIKLQPEPTGTDNWAAGSIAVVVDPETGVLGTGLLKKEAAANRRESLPGSGVTFTGLRLPFWAAVMDLARAAAAAFPHAHTIGWDIAITGRGPYLVEGNVSWDPFQTAFGKGVLTPALRRTVAQLRARGKLVSMLAQPQPTAARLRSALAEVKR